MLCALGSGETNNMYSHIATQYKQDSGETSSSLVPTNFPGFPQGKRSSSLIPRLSAGEEEL